MNIKFDLKNFQNNVYKEYKSFVRMISPKRSTSRNGYAVIYDNSDSGFYDKSSSKLLKMAQWFIRNLYFCNPISAEWEKEAVRIINDLRIKEMLCPIFKRNISPDFFKEELEIKVITIVTISLTKKDTSEKFSIERNEKLFALIIYGLLKIGIENYCSNNDSLVEIVSKPFFTDKNS